MTFEFYAEAEAEMLAGIDYLDGQEFGLGLRLTREIYSTIRRIVENPNAWPKSSSRTRRCFTKRFRYQIIYQIRNDEIHIVAVAHTSRRPGYWKSRLR